MSDSVKSPTSNAVPYIMLGSIIVLVMFGGIGTWAAITPLSGAIIAPGVVTVYSKRKTVQHLEGGIVSEILVRDGDHVQQGQLLVRLDDTQVTASLRILDGQLNILRARAARLKAERDGDSEIRFPARLSDRRTDSEVADVIRGESELFRARRGALQGEVDILTERVSQLENEIAGLTAQRRSKVRQIQLIRDELVTLRELYEKGYASKTRLLTLERSAEALKGERGELVAQIARAKSTIGETKLQIIQIEKEFRQTVIEELHQDQSDVFDLEERRVAVADEAKRIEIRAPQNGIVVGLDVHTLGGIVSPGQPILDIVPEEDELVIEAQIAPHDIDKVRPGLVSTVRFSAFNLRSTPEITGKVFVASADRLFDNANGQHYYLAGVRIEKDELLKIKDLKLVPGMPAEVFVETGERTALSYLAKPLTDALTRTFREE